MALNPKLSNAGANAAADAVARLVDNGYLRLYSGTQPANADTAVGAQTLLAELRFSATSAPAAVNGALTFNAIASDDVANATGTCTWFRALQSNGTGAVFDGSVGTSNANLNLNSVEIQSGATVSVSGMTYTQQKG